MTLTEEEKSKIEEEEIYRLGLADKLKDGESYREEVKTKLKEKKNIQSEREGEKAKITKKGWVFLIGFFILICYVFLMSRVNSSSTAPSPTPATKSWSPPSGNINMSRKKIMNAMKDDFTFVKSDPIGGQENYVAKTTSVDIQLLGPENNLNSASITANVLKSADGATNVGESVVAQAKILTFAGAFGSECSQWFINKELQTIGPNPTKPTEIKEVACGRTLSLIYLPGYATTFGISSANQ